MADHVAKQLLDAVIAAVTGLTSTGANVFKNRPDGRPLRSTELPGLLVYLGGEDVQLADVGGSITQRTQRIRIGLRVKSTEGSDDTLCTIRAEVEAALFARLAVGPPMGTKPIQLVYDGMDDPEFEGDIEQPVAAAELKYSAMLFTSAADVLL
jgi:hypothetical protein